MSRFLRVNISHTKLIVKSFAMINGKMNFAIWTAHELVSPNCFYKTLNKRKLFSI